MTFISYAQNLEDVMLQRVFCDIEKGFYIDVGAWDPLIDSVTKAFYDRGWHGINIEPSQSHYEKLNNERPNDINLNVGIAEAAGVLPYYEIPNTGLSTIDLTIAETHRKKGWEIIEKKIPVITLSDIYKNYPSNTIHFLKIDVEGAERRVLLGADFKYFRPWVLIIESLQPLSPKDNSADWESILIENNYKFVYFDGLNRFYLAAEQNRLLKAFASPPNLFDDYTRYTELVAKQKIQHELSKSKAENQEILTQLTIIDKEYQDNKYTLNSVAEENQKLEIQLTKINMECKDKENKLNVTNKKIQNIQVELNILANQKNHFKNELNAVYGSRCWQLVKYIRFISYQLKNSLRFVKRATKKILKQSIQIRKFTVKQVWEQLRKNIKCKKSNDQHIQNEIICTDSTLPQILEETLKKWPRRSRIDE